MGFGSVDVGVVIVAATSLLWPAACWLYVALSQRVGLPAWKVFARGGIAALIVAALLAGWAAWLLATNGTAQSMASLGPQVAALTILAGGVICGVIALVLRLRQQRSSAAGEDGRS
jgi:hypothetical protein